MKIAFCSLGGAQLRQREKQITCVPGFQPARDLLGIDS